MAEHDPAAMRLHYDKFTLDDSQLASNPLEQFRLWLADAVDCPEIVEPNALVLATSGDGLTTRSVLMKGIDERGLTFYTNYDSRKARSIAADPAVALLFPWYPLHRQVAVTGTAAKVSREEAAEYFAVRPHLSQLGAMASDQSEPIDSRAVLEERMAELQDRYPDGTHVDLPDDWGGYLVTVDTIEFWQGRQSRLHDRLRFEAVGTKRDIADPDCWRVQRYAP